MYIYIYIIATTIIPKAQIGRRPLAKELEPETERGPSKFEPRGRIFVCFVPVQVSGFRVMD